MLRDNKIVEKRKLEIPNIQKYLFFALLLLTPLTIMPFPWDWTERGMALVILVISVVIVALELVKLIWEGKTTFLKSALDGGILAVLASLTLSTIFSKDFNSSVWGMDGRLGAGLISFIAVVLVCLCARTFIKSRKDIIWSLMAFIISFSIVDILSILSFLGVNVWGFLPIYKNLSQVGLPLVRSAKVHLLLNFILILTDLEFIVDYLIDKTKKNTTFTISIISGILAAVNIWFFSINQGIGMLCLFVLVLAFIAFLGIKKLKLSKGINKNIILVLCITFVLVLLPTILLMIPSLRGVILPKSINVVAQVSLGADVSWIIAASVLVSSFGRGLLGMGMDNFSIAYNAYKPLSTSLLQYNNVNFYYSGTEFFTQFTNGGLIWILAWGFLGFVIIKMLIKDFNRVKIYKDDLSSSWYLLAFDTIITFIYLASFVGVYSILIIVLLFVLIALRSVLLEILNRATGERFVIKLWTANLKPENESGNTNFGLNVGLTIIVGLTSLALLIMFGSKTIASLYTLKAEAYYVEENNKYTDTTPTIDQREDFVNNMVHYYSQAAKFDGEDPLINRKTGTMYLELVGIAAEKYSKSSSSSDNSSLISNVGEWKNYALDYTRKSIDTDKAVYANWEARTQVYMGLVGMGFKDYVSDSLYSLQQAALLNPLNYELYYNEAQIYVINSDKDSALSSLTKVLGINAQHIPSILLAAEINKEKGNTDVYESYLKAAKKILETNSETSSDVYKQVTTELNSLASSTASGTEGTSK